MLTTNEPTDEISRSSNNSDQPCRLIPTFQLPKDLLYEVFLRLPVKSLFRFRCVSKGMYGMIDSSNFINNHNNHRSVIISERDGSLPDDEDYAIFLYQRKNNNRLFSVNFDKEDNNLNLNRAKAIELNCTFSKEGMIPMGWCCNGIFCFKNHIQDPTRYVLWNPSNGTFREVDCSSCDLIPANVSMGYDYVNDDYKIIRVIIVDTKSEPSLEVYSFRKDSWRKFRSDFSFPSGNYGLIEAVCLRGVMHWLWSNRNRTTDSSMFISAFDLVTETFTSLPLPLEARELNLEPCHVTEFGGRLCINFYPSGYGGGQTVWVMEKYGVETSWTKVYTFNPPHRIPCFYYPNNERRLLCNIRGLSWWNSEDDTVESIEFTGPSYDRLVLTQAFIYVRNLVRLDQS